MLALYVHLPFCTTHCTYCPFAISTDLAQQDAYTTALVRERGVARGFDRHDLPRRRHAIADEPRQSRAHLRGDPRALRRSNRCRDLDGANPEDVTPESVAAWRALGVNRLSIGVQSFTMTSSPRSAASTIARARSMPCALRWRRRARESRSHARAAASDRESFRETLDTAIDLGAGHLSLYMLDLEEKTPLQVQVARGRVVLPEDDLVADLYSKRSSTSRRAGSRNTRSATSRAKASSAATTFATGRAASTTASVSPRIRSSKAAALREYARHPPLHRHRTGRARLQRRARRRRSAPRNDLPPAPSDDRDVL
jgi:oxygen-independent coproporphyrinogen-3 oxidase